MSGLFEKLLEQNKTLIDQNQRILSQLNEQTDTDKSWIDVPFILKDLSISSRDFHRYWKKKMPFLRRYKGPGSNYRAHRYEYEEWKVKYWESLKMQENGNN